MKQNEISLLFENILEVIDLILESDFYTQKKTLPKIKVEILGWFNDFKKNNTLMNIPITVLKDVDLEVADIFDNYIEIEAVKQNYVERLSYYFSILKKEWKDEMLGGK